MVPELGWVGGGDSGGGRIDVVLPPPPVTINSLQCFIDSPGLVSTAHSPLRHPRPPSPTPINRSPFRKRGVGEPFSTSGRISSPLELVSSQLIFADFLSFPSGLFYPSSCPVRHQIGSKLFLTDPRDFRPVSKRTNPIHKHMVLSSTGNLL